MEPQNSTSSASTRIVENTDLAEFLLNHATQKLLHPFIGKAESVSQAAKSLDMSISALLYRVQKLQEWDVLHVVREEQRAGRPIKFYAATSDSFFVPFGATRAETLERYLTETKDYFAALMTRNVAEVMRRAEKEWGIRVYKDSEENIRTQMATYPDKVVEIEQSETAVLDFYYPGLRLSREDAKAFRQELSELVQKYASKSGRQPYLLHIGLTPVIRD